MFLSDVWALLLTAPIHCRGSIGVLHFSKSFSIKKNILIYILDGLRVSTFSVNFHFLGELSLNCPAFADGWPNLIP